MSWQCLFGPSAAVEDPRALPTAWYKDSISTNDYDAVSSASHQISPQLSKGLRVCLLRLALQCHARIGHYQHVLDHLLHICQLLLQVLLFGGGEVNLNALVHLQQQGTNSQVWDAF